MANKSHDSKLSRSIETLNLLREYAQDANRNFEDLAIKLCQNAAGTVKNYLVI